MIENIGWLGGIMFALCGLPQAITSIKQGHSRGISSWFLFLWLSGEILMQIYVIGKHGMDLPLLVNYWFNTILILIIIKYKIKEVKK